MNQLIVDYFDNQFLLLKSKKITREILTYQCLSMLYDFLKNVIRPWGSSGSLVVMAFFVVFHVSGLNSISACPPLSTNKKEKKRKRM